MIDRQRGDVVFECDGCGEVLETATSNFDSALNMMRREGWRAVCAGNVWSHFCASCGRKA